MAKDPICGMEVNPERASGSSLYAEKTYYFCNPNCKKKFDEDPEAVLSPKEEAIEDKSKETLPATGRSVSVTLPVEGMSCVSCANTIENALKKKVGVTKAVINFASGKVTVEYDPAVLDEGGLVKVIESAGYGVPVAIEKGVLKILGMTCASCANTIEKALNKAAGGSWCNGEPCNRRGNHRF